MRLKNASNQRQNKRVRSQLFEEEVTWGLSEMLYYKIVLGFEMTQMPADLGKLQLIKNNNEKYVDKFGESGYNETYNNITTKNT